MQIDLDDLATTVSDFIASCAEVRVQAASMLLQNRMLMHDHAAFSASVPSPAVIDKKRTSLQVQTAASVAAFIVREIDLGTAFLDYATRSRRGHLRKRGAQNALTAYEAARRFIKNPVLSREQLEDLGQALEALRLKLLAVSRPTQRIPA